MEFNKIIVATFLIAGVLTGCKIKNISDENFQAHTVTQSSVAQSISETKSSSEQPKENLKSDLDNEQPSERIYVADASMYRGVVSQIEKSGDVALSFALTQYLGSNFGAESVRVAAGAQTQFGFNPEILKEGDYIEIFYSESLPESAEQALLPIAINRLGVAELILLDGAVKSITPMEEEGTGQILVTDLKNEQEVIVRYGSETQMYLNLDLLKKGDKIQILYSGAMTKSLPPQVFALEIWPHK